MADYFEKYCLEFAATNIRQNGVSGQDGRVIANIARCLLKNAGFLKTLWGQTFFTATYLASRMPHSALQRPAPFTVLSGVHAKLDHLRATGARPFVHVKPHSRKLESKAGEGRLCGYSMNSKAYRIHNPETRRVVASHNVIFIEIPMPTLLDPYTSNNNGDAADPQEGSSSSENTADISITDHNEVPRLLRRMLELTTNKSTSQEAPTPESSTTPGTLPSGDD